MHNFKSYVSSPTISEPLFADGSHSFQSGKLFDNFLSLFHPPHQRLVRGRTNFKISFFIKARENDEESLSSTLETDL